MAESGRHHEGSRRRPVVLAAGLTAAVAVGAVGLVGALRDGGPPPRSPDRAAPTLTGSPGPTGSLGPTGSPSPSPVPTPVSRVTSRQAQPAPAGTLRPTPARTAPATTAPAAGPPASRDRRPAPASTAAGRATFYTLAGLPNCGYPDAAGTGSYVALAPAAYAAAAACGTVLDVTGPRGTVRVTVADLCPECEPGHLDLAAPAFARIADPVAGTVPVSYARVVDPPTPGDIRVRVKEGSSAYWLALLPLDTGNPLASVAVRAGTGWQPLQRSSYGYWIAAAGAGPGPYQVRLVDDRGHTAVVTVPLRPGAIVGTGIRLY